MLLVTIPFNQKQGLVLLLTRRMNVEAVTRGLVLVQEDYTMTPTRVATKQHTVLIMETSTSKPWVTSWCSKMDEVSHL